MDDFENKNKTDKDVSKSLSQEGSMRTSAVSFLTETADGINKWYEEQHAKLLEGEKKSLIQTAESNKETAESVSAEGDNEVTEAIQTMLQNDIDNESDIDVNSTQLRYKKSNRSKIQTNLINRSEENENTSCSKIQTNVNKKRKNAVNIDEDDSEKTSDNSKTKKKKKSLLVRAGVFTKYQSKDSKHITLGLKTVNTVNRKFNKFYQKGKRLHTQISEGGNVQTGLKDFSNSAKKVAAKPVKIATKPLRRKAKTVAVKGTIKLTKLAVKAVIAVGKLLIKLIGLLIAYLPVVAVVLIILVAVISVCSIFGANMKKSEMTKLKEYMIATQQYYDDITVPYYEDGYIVENSIQGRGHIDWKAPLSILQGLGGTQSELHFGNAETALLEAWKEAELLECIEEETYTEIAKEGDQETEVTVTKYVIINFGLEDYIEWCREYWDSKVRDYLITKMDDKSVPEDFTKDQLEIIKTLYESDSFDELLEDITVENSNDNTANSGGGNVIPGGGNGTLRYPTNSTAISAGFPNYSDGSYHGGIDFPVPMNTDVCAAEDGKVIFAGTAPPDNNGGYGNYVVIEHKINGRTIITLYGHNTSLLVKAGDTVKRGQVIAKSGSTGNSTGPHVHFEVQLDKLWGTRVNPLDYLK